jgi:type II secretory pathway component PulJ
MKMHRSQNRHGFMLLDCIAYIGLLAIILTLAFMCFYETLDNSKRLNRSASDIVRALNAGEKWRTDVRTAFAAARFEAGPNGAGGLRLTQPSGEVFYTFRDGAVWRRAGSNTQWTAFLRDVERSRIEMDQRKQVRCLRWELELKPGKRKSIIKPLFTFQAVPRKEQGP